jgi:V/A-type H+-transporting ATPase subunit I
MLRAVPMAHVRIQIANRDAAGATRAIARAGLLHLVDIAHGRLDTAPPATAELLAAFQVLRERIRALAACLGLPLRDPAGAVPVEQGRGDFQTERERLEAALAPLEQQTAAVCDRLATAQAAEESARGARRQQARLESASVDLERLRGLQYATVRLGTAAPEELESLALLLAPAPSAVVPLDAGPNPLAAAVVPRSLQDRLAASLRLVKFTEIASVVSAPSESATLDAAARAAALECDAARVAVDEARSSHAAAIARLWQRVDTAVLLLEAQLHFISAGRFVVVSGWVPAESAPALREAVLAATERRAVIEIQRPDDLPEARSGALKIPILYRNPLLLRPFQGLLELYGTPKYRELEPTAFLAASFLLMFGLMFGDVGHGAVLFSAGYYVFRYVPRFLDYGILLMEAGAASAVFGFLYGSLFGLQGVLPVLWLEPIRDLPRFMGIALAFGAFLITVGLALNIVNSWRLGERRSAIWGTRGLFGAFLYWTCVGLAVRALLPRGPMVPGWLLAIVGGGAIALLLLRRPLLRRLDPVRVRPASTPAAPRWLTALEGSVEIVDALFSYFANTISFVRIAAFAAVHAGVFVAMFSVAESLGHFRLGGVLSIAALVGGNVVLILLEGLTVSVQVLRLEYYEFFSKFFRGGGETYRPLMLRPSPPRTEAQS